MQFQINLHLFKMNLDLFYSMLLLSYIVAGKSKVELTREAVVGVTRLAFLCKQSLEKGTVIEITN